MKGIFKKIINEHPKMFVLLLIFILFAMTMAIYRIADHYLNTTSVKTMEFYTYNGENRLEFDADITINRKGTINDVKPSINIDFTNVPLYSKNKIVFANEMIVVNTKDNYKLNRSLNYLYLDIKENVLIEKDFENTIDGYIIYDGRRVFFFGDDGVLEANQNKLHLNKYSTIILDNETIRIYDYFEDSYEKLPLEGDIKFTTKYVEVDLKEKKVLDTNYILVENTENLEVLKN